MSKHKQLLLKSVTYSLQSNQLRQACIVVRMEIICQSQFQNTNTPHSEIADIQAAELVAPSVHFRPDGNHLSVIMSKHNTPYSQIADIRAAIESVAPSVHCRSDGNHLSVKMSNHNTPYSEIGDILAAIESVARSVHCRSDGNHLSVTTSKHNTHPLLKSPTYKLQSNQLRQACIVVQMESFVSHNVETQTHPLLKSATYTLQSNQLRQACIVVPMEIICQSQCRNTTHPILNRRHTRCNRISCAMRALSFGWKSFVSHNFKTQTHPILKSPTYKLPN
jgi:predicted protein tyrosine phosphatase